VVYRLSSRQVHINRTVWRDPSPCNAVCVCVCGLLLPFVTGSVTSTATRDMSFFSSATGRTDGLPRSRGYGEQTTRRSCTNALRGSDSSLSGGIPADDGNEVTNRPNCRLHWLFDRWTGRQRRQSRGKMAGRRRHLIRDGLGPTTPWVVSYWVAEVTSIVAGACIVRVFAPSVDAPLIPLSMGTRATTLAPRRCGENQYVP